MAKPRKLDRLLRVRTLQLDQVRAQEAAANAKLAQEEALRARIAQLAASVAPAPAPRPSDAAGFIAAAHFRDRLAQSAAAAEQRVRTAERGVDAARAATREAKRDQDAIEKLIERARADETLKAMRALEALPPARRVRHDPC